MALGAWRSHYVGYCFNQEVARKSEFCPLIPFVGAALTGSDVGDLGPVNRVFLALHNIGWFLLDIALMLRQSEEPSEPGLFA